MVADFVFYKPCYYFVYTTKNVMLLSHMFDSECDEVDGFIASYKTLRGPMPAWHQHFARDWTVRWAVIDEHEAQRGELVLTVDHRHANPTLLCLFKRRLIYRLDVVPTGERKPNPWGAHALGLPHEVAGPHVHGWLENRNYVRVNGFGVLPYRRSMGGVVVSLADGLGWVAEDLEITISAEQRVCDLPPQAQLI